MHQFGHVYALQQELLSPSRSDWFRAAELWHTARHEGLALNSAHYTNILRQCVPSAAWEQALLTLKQMSRDALRPDVTGVACSMAACVDAKRYHEAAAVFTLFHSKMKLDSQCHLAMVRAQSGAGQHASAIESGAKQMDERIPMIPETVSAMIDAAAVTGDAGHCRVAMQAAEELEEELVCVSAPRRQQLRDMVARHHIPCGRWLDHPDDRQAPDFLPLR